MRCIYVMGQLFCDLFLVYNKERKLLKLLLTTLKAKNKIGNMKKKYTELPLGEKQ